MGSEVEYGIQVLGNPGANPMQSSSWVVNAYAAAELNARRARWDFEEEHPLRDARGHEIARENADPSQLTDEDLGLANVILTNGARLYVDHAHPEFSSPEVTTPIDVVRWEKAGEEVMRRAAELVNARGGPSVVLYKNNTDGKGVSYGTHENYLMARATPFRNIVKHLIPFFVSRQVVCGAGRVGIGRDGRHPGFQLSQRADFFEVEVGLETTMRRPIVNTRDEPHADPSQHRRLHVIVGDANLAEVSTFLKYGTTALVLDMIEADVMPDDLALRHPVAELRAVSHDPSLAHRVELVDGRLMTALDLQWIHLERARDHVKRTGADEDPQTVAVMERWESVLTRLETNPMLCAGELDWVAKLKILQRYRERDGLAWDHPKLALVDLQYADLRTSKGLHHKLVAGGHMERLVDAEAVLRAVTEPPEDTRAWFRGQCLLRYPDEVAAASWDSVILDLPGRSSLQRIPTPDPLRGTKARVGGLLDRHRTAAELFAALTADHR
nr:depupylase/deamidase Dop [Nocardioides yefusunii]